MGCTGLEFANSINPGITVDGAGECRAIGLKGDKLDVCLVVTSSKNVFVEDCTATNMLSDGFMFAGNINVRANNLKVERSPHGIMLHGNNSSILKNCEVTGALEAFNISKYGDDTNYFRSGFVRYEYCNSTDCLIPFAFSHVYKAEVEGGLHENIGQPNHFLDRLPETPPRSVYTSDVNFVDFNGVIMRLGPDKLVGYQTPHFYGLVYQYYRPADGRN